MKYFLPLAILLTTCMFTQAQKASFPMKAGKVHYEIIDSSLHGFTKDQLYSMSKLWVYNNFNTGRQLELDIPAAGLIAGNMTLPSNIGFTVKGSLKGPYSCSFSFIVISKDGRYKAQLYDFRLTNTIYGDSYSLEYPLSQPEKIKDHKNVLPTLESEAYGFIRSIKLAMESVYNFMDF